MDHNLPTPPNPGSYHGWAELLTLVGAIRRIAYLPSYTMDCDEQMRQIRDLLLDFDHPEAAEDA